MVLVYFLRTVTESDSDDSEKKAKPCRRHAGWYMCKQINMFSICDRSILEVISARVLFALRLCVTSVDCSQMVVSYSDHIQTPRGYWSLSWLFACQTPSKIVVPFFNSCRWSVFTIPRFEVNRYMLSAWIFDDLGWTGRRAIPYYRQHSASNQIAVVPLTVDDLERVVASRARSLQYYSTIRSPWTKWPLTLTSLGVFSQDHESKHDLVQQLESCN